MLEDSKVLDAIPGTDLQVGDRLTTGHDGEPIMVRVLTTDDVALILHHSGRADTSPPRSAHLTLVP
jgi:hypothetical protein